MTALQLYLPPMLGLVALSYLTALAILISRILDLVRERRRFSFYEDFDGGGAPQSVLRPTRQLANQFEFPVLFYAVLAVAIAVPFEEAPMLQLAWSYVILRWAHALSHMMFNRLYIRTPIFMGSNLVLLAMWATLALGAFS